ncbi:MAG: recombinase family protein, partial [Lutibacter sp.]|uniref:recombinase family protein n=1 Tax=Lutibacter sp. TaxID=1925666 RepID=UPI0017B93101
MLGILCRISGDKEEGKDRSIHEQELLGIALASKLGLSYKLYKEENVSGTLPIEERQELDRLLNDIEEGKVTSMFIWVQNRLERNPQTRYIVLETLREHHCRLFIETGEVDLFDDDANMYGDIQSLFVANYVRDT